jgi:hypothetical protein
MKVPVLVEIPDTHELACPYLRPPKKGELYFVSGRIEVAGWDYGPSYERIVVRPAWKWPEKLKAAAIVQCSNALWFACEGVPEREGSFWSGGGSWLNLTHAADKFGILDFTPPPCDDWRESLRVNPNLA